MSDTEATKSVPDEDAKSNLEEDLVEPPLDELAVIVDPGATPDNKEEEEEAATADIAETEAEAKNPPDEDADEAEANAEDAEKADNTPAEAEAETEAKPEEAATENPLFRKAFSMFDLDESGEISAGEFGTVMRALGENPTDEDIEELLKSVDRDLDGKLSYDEFQTLMQKRMESRDELPEDELFRRAFRVFDKDGSGKLSKEENVVTSYGQMKLSVEDADEMLASADADGDDMVDYEEFIAMFCSGPVEVEP
eukprot:TCALIF_10412-PA protein Name:"Similar to Calmodulin (Chlamydomonas reinhardtii)" AED:0.08 eAED:0.08 QI:77/0.75/0.8/1/0.5/0.4/5/168/252